MIGVKRLHPSSALSVKREKMHFVWQVSNEYILNWNDALTFVCIPQNETKIKNRFWIFRKVWAHCQNVTRLLLQPSKVKTKKWFVFTCVFSRVASFILSQHLVLMAQSKHTKKTTKLRGAWKNNGEKRRISGRDFPKLFHVHDWNLMTCNCFLSKSYKAWRLKLPSKMI